jgi:hypothetical protein
MDAEKMKELLFSLSWYDASCYHADNVREILGKEFPSVDFSAELKKFVECKTMPAGPGCPR